MKPEQNGGDGAAVDGIDAAGIVLSTPSQPTGIPIDVEVDGHRVWSFVTKPAERARLHAWPDQLARHMDGTGTITVRRSQDRRVIDERFVRIGSVDTPRRVVDNKGRWMAVNKWGNLGVPLDGHDGQFASRLLERTEVLIRHLREFGVEPFVCSGSLLGALRGGKLLPHDDDVDLGFVAPTEHPADLNLVSYEMQRALERLDYTIVRHSGSHLQVTYLLEDGGVDHYIDIFTGYFRHEEYSQPFAMRGPMATSSILPLGTVELEGHRFPAPARADDWLAMCYGPDWRVPDPSFTFDVPRSTTRRFEAWFGSFNYGRDHWEQVYRDRRSLDAGLSGLESLVTDDEFLVDVGAGASSLARNILDRGGLALAVDYSVEALARQTAAGVPNRYRNANDRRDMLHLVADIAQLGRSAVIVLDGVIEWMRPETRENIELLLRGVFAAGGRVLVRVRQETAPTGQTPYFDGAADWITALAEPYSVREVADGVSEIRDPRKGM
ncbi:hypothetical protein ACFCVO_04620 [Agromyces sp. NPDC056379]|uniref:hypothetical protein n=1 Tax=unclassified Agromyces TaxID=2639701 RepID=UPI0035DDDD1A